MWESKVCWGRRLGTTPPLQLLLFHTLQQTNTLKHTSCFIFYKALLHVLLYFLTATNFSDVPGPCHTVRKRQELSPLFLGCKWCYSRKHGYSQNCLPNARFPLGMVEDTVTMAKVLSIWKAPQIPSSHLGLNCCPVYPIGILRGHPSGLVRVINCRGRRRQNWICWAGRRGGGWRLISASDWVWLTQCPHFSRTFITGSPALKLILRFPYRCHSVSRWERATRIAFKYVASFNCHKSLSAYVLSFPVFTNKAGKDQKLNNLPKGTVPNSYDIYSA